MEDPSSLSSPKLSRPTTGKRGPPKSGQAQPFRLHTEQRGQRKEQELERRLREFEAEDAKLRIRTAQGLPLTTEKPQNLPRPPVKEQTKPLNFKLHTEQRAARRAGFDGLVASKISSLEILRRFEEKIRKVIEEEEIKLMRKEMVPKAQLMPIFDRPFLPQRSSRPLTVGREPSFCRFNKKWVTNEDPYRMLQYYAHSMEAIK